MNYIKWPHHETVLGISIWLLAVERIILRLVSQNSVLFCAIASFDDETDVETRNNIPV